MSKKVFAEPVRTQGGPLPENGVSDKKGFFKRGGRQNLGVFSLSVFIHAGLLLLVGGVVITEGLIPRPAPQGELAGPESVLETEPEPVEETLLPENTSTETEAASAGAAAEAMPEVLVASVQAPSFTVSSPALSPTSFSGTGQGSSSGDGSGNGSGNGTGGVRGAKKVQMFNTEIEAKKLGAVVDVSGTATPYLLPTLKEIQKNFEDAPIILACGCALTVPKGVAKPFSEFDLSIPAPTGPAGYNALGYIKSTMKSDENVDRLMRRLQKNPGVFLLEGNGLDVTNAIQKLADEGVDAIYWFSDFRDGVNETLAGKVAGDLKSKGIKLYIHSFTGQPIPPVQKAMVETTGGKTIVQVPKK